MSVEAEDVMMSLLTQELVTIAARTVLEAIDLDQVAEAAAARVSCSGRKPAWKVVGRDGIKVRMTPFAVVKMNQEYMQKYKRRGLERHNALADQVKELKQTVDAVIEAQENYEAAMNRRVRKLEAAVAALEARLR